MSQKKMTPIIAKALAEKVKQELQKRNKNLSETLKTKVESSKEFKAYLKLHNEVVALSDKKEELRKAITEKYSSNLCDVSIPGYSQNTEVYVRDTIYLSVESIKDMILIEDYMSDSSLTSEEFVNLIVEKLTK
jgi:hypothetical protein